MDTCDSQPRQGKRWGVFDHFRPVAGAAATPEEWNRQVDGFDVSLLARELHQAGAAYFGIVIGQNSGFYCAPNETYDRLVGYDPGKCSRRDLVADLYDALTPYGIDLYAYLPSGAPCDDPRAVKNLEWEWNFVNGLGHWDGPTTGHRLAAFQEKWEAVIREWSLRWGPKIKGWWLDGCYFPDDMYRFPDAPNFASLAAALRAGNPRALVAFNRGLENPFDLQSEWDDYTAGEVGYSLPIPMPWQTEPLGGKLLHVFTYLGQNWGQGEPRFPDDLPVGYSQLIAEKGGVITWDVPVQPDGSIPEAFQRQLNAIGNRMKCI